MRHNGDDMACLVGCLALVTPRLAIVLVVVFSDFIGRAYETTLWPLLGFFVLPLTTLAYAWAINANGSVSGGYLAVVVLVFSFGMALWKVLQVRAHEQAPDTAVIRITHWQLEAGFREALV